MQIIVLDEEFPYPLNTGKRIRTYNLISRLAKKHTIRYLAYGEENSESFRAMQSSGITPIAVPPQVPEKSGLRFYYRLFRNLFSPLPYIVDSHFSKPYAEELARLVATNPPDLLLMEWSPYAVYGWRIKHGKQVIVAHNVESHIWRRYYENEKNAARRWYIKQQHTKVARFERKAFLHANAATAVSQKEAEELRTISPSLPVAVVDNGVDLEYFAPAANPVEQDTLIFTGSMDWRPNQDAAEYFAHDILPLLKRTHPDIQAVFVGRNPPPHIRALGEITGMVITGTVDDVRPYIAKGAVYIVPLRVGGGSRLKILEALSMKKAVVSTTVGAEGLETTNGTDILLADNAADFADAVGKLLADLPLRARMGDAGRELVMRRYGWDSLAGTLEQFLTQVAGK